MLHDGNKIHGDPYSEETIKLLREHLVQLHKDKDNQSLFVRFNRLMRRVKDQERSHEATWNTLLKVSEKKKDA